MCSVVLLPHCRHSTPGHLSTRRLALEGERRGGERGEERGEERVCTNVAASCDHTSGRYLKNEAYYVSEGWTSHNYPRRACAARVR